MKFGRRPRAHDPRVPKMSLVRKGALPPYPQSIDYATGMAANLGAMLNDTLGCCVESAAGHAIQVWSFNTQGAMVTPPDSAIGQFYELAGGYVPGNASTDQGTIMQVALADWLKNPVAGNELAAFVEVTPLSVENVKSTIYECGLIYVGFNVPAYMPMASGSVWDVNPTADNTIIGGHCVAVVGYDANGNMIVISWGVIFMMTPAFFAQFVDEVYALANPDWIKQTGQTPAGLSLPQLESIMGQFSAPVPNAPSAPIVQ
jgi:hypothetical protein